MRPIQYWQALTHLGPGWVLFRARWDAAKRLGLLKRRSPVGRWEDIHAGHASAPLGFDCTPAAGKDAVDEAERILRGRFTLFSAHQVDLGKSPRWTQNPLSGACIAGNAHWSELDVTRAGDIKCVWELSRFGWAFALARAYRNTGDTRYAERFWQLFEDWMDHNLPNCGPNWMCGQEATFRLMAATFAAQVCAKAESSTVARQNRFRQFVAATGARIAAHLEYALSQSNNHGVSECVGLITAALLLPDAIDSPRWRQVGMDRLRLQLAELVYADGGFAQHSANYHRVLLHDLLWLLSVLRLYKEQAPEWLMGSARRALEFMADLMDPDTGRIPLYGANDGANVLPLADVDYLDFRPVIQAGAFVLHGQRWLPPGPWDEAAVWLGNGMRLPQALTPREWLPSRAWPDAGICQVRSGAARLTLRCPTRFRHRPSQADLLHVDVGWRGEPITVDPGSYSYHASGRLGGALKEAAVHNTLTIERGEPIRSASRFLYLPWPHGDVWYDESGEVWATHNGWRSIGANHSRHVTALPSDGFEVEDHITCRHQQRVRLHWLFADLPHQLEVEQSRLMLRTEQGAYAVEWTVPPDAVVDLVRADPHSNRGWASPYYHHLEPALSLAIECTINAQASFVTRFRSVPA